MVSNQLILRNGGDGPQKKQIWLYDAWVGLPEVLEEDGPAAKLWAGKMAVPDAIELIRARLRSKTKVDLHSIRFHKGWFNERFKLPGPAQISMLHTDGDWYRSVLDALNRFEPLVVDGGVVVIDDFGFWEGARLAFYDYVAKKKLYPLVERTGTSQLAFGL